MKIAIEPSAEVIAACKSGDHEAFRTIFNEYKSYAFNLIYKITGPSSEHEDLLQEVFYQIFISLHTFQGASSFSTWFHRLVVQVCSGSLRYKKAAKRSPGGAMIGYEDMQEMVADKKPSQESAFEMKNLVEKGLATLDDSLRMPLVLSVYGELDINEIATVLNVPEGTVKSRLFFGRKKMKEFIQAAG
jgi:RNA polymerase sigma-70 factor (ECF subfamily)